MKDEKDGHITTRVDPELKKKGIEHAKNIERKKAWVFARAIELGLPEVFKQYPAPKRARA
jgi:predicted transcriptional regulator